MQISACSSISSHSWVGKDASTVASVEMMWFLTGRMARSALFCRWAPAGTYCQLSLCSKNKASNGFDVSLLILRADGRPRGVVRRKAKNRLYALTYAGALRLERGSRWA